MVPTQIRSQRAEIQGGDDVAKRRCRTFSHALRDAGPIRM